MIFFFSVWPHAPCSKGSLGNACGSLGDYNKKKDMLERALKIEEKAYGSDHVQVGRTLYNIGCVLARDPSTEDDALARLEEVRLPL